MVSFILLLIFTACSITVGNHKERYDIYGRWKLTKVSGGPSGTATGVTTSQQVEFGYDNTFKWYKNGSLWAHGSVTYDVVNNVKEVSFSPDENVNIVNKRYSITEQSQLHLVDECSGCYFYVFDPA